MNYISRRVRESESRENEGRMEHYPEHPEYPDNRISSRYNTSAPQYPEDRKILRMEQGRSEQARMHTSNERSEQAQIGFVRGGKTGDQDFIYQMEESFEKEIDDIVFYAELAMEAESKGHTEFANGFYEIAKEKLTCAEYVRNRLIKSGHYDPSKQDEIEDRFDRAKHLFRRL